MRPLLIILALLACGLPAAAQKTSQLPAASAISDSNLINITQGSTGSYTSTAASMALVKAYVLAGTGSFTINVTGAATGSATGTGSLTLTLAGGTGTYTGLFDGVAFGGTGTLNIGTGGTLGSAAFQSSSAFALAAGPFSWADVTGAPAFITAAGAAATITGTITASQVSGLSSTATTGTAAALTGSITISQVQHLTDGTSTINVTNTGASGYATSSGTSTYAAMAGSTSTFTGTITASQVSGLSSAATSLISTGTYISASGASGALWTYVTPASPAQQEWTMAVTPTITTYGNPQNVSLLYTNETGTSTGPVYFYKNGVVASGTSLNGTGVFNLTPITFCTAASSTITLQTGNSGPNQFNLKAVLTGGN